MCGWEPPKVLSSRQNPQPEMTRPPEQVVDLKGSFQGHSHLEWRAKSLKRKSPINRVTPSESDAAEFIFQAR